jgi:hypothetical protein
MTLANSINFSQIAIHIWMIDAFLFIKSSRALVK